MSSNETVFSVGDTARIYLEIISAGAGQVSQSPTVAIQRVLDDAWFQASDGTWQATVVANAMTQTDSVNLPGLYHFDFDQSLDDEAGSVRYVVRKVNSGAPTVLEYEHLRFGPVARTTSPELCSVQGTIYDSQGLPVPNVLVQATLIPVYKDTLGRSVQSDEVQEAYTNEQGDFDLPLVRGAVFRLQISEVGYDRRVTMPDQASALFTDL